jgi:hypothetical protein
MVSPTRTTRSAAPTVGAQPRGPLVLARYRLHRRLGSGGFGTVWLARDERLERDVAVKLLPRERIVGGRFEREARAAARLGHPGIVTLYEAAVDDEGAYLVSELVRGSTLAQLLDAGRLSDRDLVAIGIALCDALVHAHAQGVVHRDVKPSNVLIPEHPAAPGQIAKLTDFGVARVIGGDSLTRTGDVIGTAAYMAPEQAEGREAGASADLYSLALVLYEALTGINPIATGTAAQRARRLGAYLPPLRRQRRDLPRELGRSIDLALRPRPRERGSVEELRAALVASLEQVDDTPGALDTPLQAATWPSEDDRELARHDHVGFPHEAPMAAPVDGQPVEPVALPRARLRWSERALAGVAAAGIAAWLVGHLLVRAPLAPAAAALAAALAAAALPRIGWLALALSAAGALAAQQRIGAALLVLLAALVPVVLLFRHSARWPLVAAAPALGAIGLAGAWPALAGRAGSAWQRAALGVAGWIWLIGAGELAGHGLYTRLLAGTPPGSVWMPSLDQTANHVLSPALASGLFAPALVWGAAAVVLPWITSSRSLALQVVLVTIWTATLASATTTVLRAVHAGISTQTNAVVAGAVAAGLVALLPSLFGRWRPPHRAADPSPGLA